MRLYSVRVRIAAVNFGVGAGRGGRMVAGPGRYFVAAFPEEAGQVIVS